VQVTGDAAAFELGGFDCALKQTLAFVKQVAMVQNSGFSSTHAVRLPGLQTWVAGRVADARGPCESTNSRITLRKRSVPTFSVEWLKPADRKRTSPGVNESSTGAAPLNDARVRPPLTNTESMSRSCRWITETPSGQARS
jgi:hypothetical protein